MPLQSHTPLEALIAVANTAHGHEGHSPIPARADPRQRQTHEHLQNAAVAREFLRRQEVALPRRSPTPADLRSLRAIRDAVRALTRGHLDEYRGFCARLLARTRYRAEPDGELLADASGWAGFIGDLALTLVAAGDLSGKMRTCANPECQWVYVDRSKNQRRRWCERGTCGNRINLRRWRARRSESRVLWGRDA